MKNLRNGSREESIYRHTQQILKRNQKEEELTIVYILSMNLIKIKQMFTSP